MPSATLILIGWMLHVLACYYFVRSISLSAIRCLVTLAPCVLLTYVVGHSLPPFQMLSMLLVTYCWLASIRLIHLTVLCPDHSLTLRAYLSKLLWMCLPIVPCTSSQQQQWPILYDFVSAGGKVLINHWMYRWLLICDGSDSYSRLLMFYVFVLTFTFLSDFQSAIIRTLTRDKYMLKPLTNFPFFSQSLREFWGQRYNQLIGTVFRESIFQPLLQDLSSKTIASFVVFTVSGLLHVHLAAVTFIDSRATMSTMTFFILHGIACTMEARTLLKLPGPLPWLLTQLFLLTTASLQIGPFTRLGPSFYAVNAPPFFDWKGIPRLPVPRSCPR